MSKYTQADELRKQYVKELVAQSEGRMFTVTALRKNPKTLEDGTVEHFMTLNCRTGVKKHLKGGKSTIGGKDDLISVYVIDRGGYRCFSAYHVLNIQINGQFVEFERDHILSMAEK